MSTFEISTKIFLTSWIFMAVFWVIVNSDSEPDSESGGLIFGIALFIDMAVMTVSALTAVWSWG